MASVTPARIMEVGMAFWPAKTLLSAVELGLFTRLGGGAMTGAELQDALGLHRRANPDFFDTLVALRFLERDGDGPDARYRNTPETAALPRQEQSPLHGRLPRNGERAALSVLGRSDRRRSGPASRRTKRSTAAPRCSRSCTASRNGSNSSWRRWRGSRRATFRPSPSTFDFSRYKTLCDVGGATGQLSMLVAQAHPHMRCISADLPAATAIAARKIAAAGVADRVSAQPLDFFADPLPKADVITMGMILHDWNLEKKMHLVRAAYDALPPAARSWRSRTSSTTPGARTRSAS